MNTQHNFVVERPIAQHCAELLRGRAAVVDPAEQLNDFTRQFAAQLALRIPGLSGGKSAAIAEVSRGVSAAYELAQTADGPRSFLQVSSAGAAVDTVVHIDRSSALTLIDQAFGGSGELPSPLPDNLPSGTGQILSRLGGMVGSALGHIANTADFLTVHQGDDFKKISPFGATSSCTTVHWRVSEAGKLDWHFGLSFAPSTLGLLAGVSSTSPQERGARALPIDPHTGSCSEIPLMLDALLAEITMPVSRVAALKPGDVIPLPMPREVPLRIAGRVFAKGTVGAQDDQIALQLSHMETPRRIAQ